MADENYLEEGFDPHELKVTQLRTILSRHKVRVPSNSKKAQLVELFEREITPNAAETSKDTPDPGSEPEHSQAASDADSRMEDVSAADTSVSKAEMEPQVLPKATRKRRIASDTSKKKRAKADDNVNPKVSVQSRDEHDEASGVASPRSPTESSYDVTPATSRIASKSETSTTEPNPESPSIASTAKSPSGSVKSPENKVKSPSLRSSRLSSPRSIKKEKNAHSIFSDDEDDVPQSPRSPILESANISKVAKNTPRSKHETPVKRTPIPKKESNMEREFEDMNDETKDFDEAISKIKKEEQNEAHPTIDLNLPSQLGVSLPQPQFMFAESETPRRLRSSAQATPRRTPRTPRNIQTLTPKPRLLPINKKHSELSDDDLEEEDEEDEDEVEKVLIQRGKKGTTDSPRSAESKHRSNEKKNSKSQKSLAPVIFTFIAWLLLVSGGLFAYWYREQVILIGYCGEQIDKPTFSNTDNKYLHLFGDYLDSNFKPHCTPCPNHARCFPNLELGCYEDFVELKPWNNFIIPNNKKCVPDTKKAEKLEIMIDVALDLLRSKNALKQCGKAEDITEAGIRVEELHDLLLSMKAPYITVEEFEELWQRSVVELEKEPDIITGPSGVSSTKLITNTNNTETEVQAEDKIFRSTSLSHLSLQCQLKNSIVGSIVQYKYNLLIMLIIFSIIKYIQHKYNQYKIELIKIDIIYKDVLSKLQHQFKLSINNRQINPFIGSAQLRDLILTNEHNLKKRVKIWNSVVYKVENNTNVSCKLIENHGEIMKVWQWITDVDE